MSVNATADELERVVKDSRDWLSQLDADAVKHKPAADRWSIAEVMGHLIDSACNNHQRFVRAQTTGKLVFPKYDQNDWASIGRYHARDWPGLFELWYQYNLQLAHLIRWIPAHKLNTPCEITGYEPCTLEFLVTDYLDHLNHHLRKIEERLSK